MRAIVVVLGINNDMSDKAWFPDFGATNHFTNDFNNLNIGTKYQGNKKRNMGNGAGLDILHIGQSTFSLPISSHPLILRSLLHVPHITKNLISVSEFHVPHMTKNLISLSQFARENQVYFEFHPSVCFVKDLEMGQILLQGMLRNGLYQFNLSCSKYQLSSPVTTSVSPNSIPTITIPICSIATSAVSSSGCFQSSCNSQVTTSKQFCFVASKTGSFGCQGCKTCSLSL